MKASSDKNPYDRATIAIQRDLHDRLRIYCAVNRVKMNQLTNDVMEKFLEMENKKPLSAIIE